MISGRSKKILIWKDSSHWFFRKIAIWSAKPVGKKYWSMCNKILIQILKAYRIGNIQKFFFKKNVLNVLWFWIFLTHIMQLHFGNDFWKLFQTIWFFYSLQPFWNGKIMQNSNFLNFKCFWSSPNQFVAVKILLAAKFGTPNYVRSLISTGNFQRHKR